MIGSLSGNTSANSTAEAPSAADVTLTTCEILSRARDTLSGALYQATSENAVSDRGILKEPETFRDHVNCAKAMAEEILRLAESLGREVFRTVSTNDGIRRVA